MRPPFVVASSMLAAWVAVLRRRVALLRIVLGWMALVPALCAAAPVVAVPIGADRLPLDGRYELLEDATRALDADGARRATGWRPAPPEPLNLGHSASAWWLRLTLRHDGDAPLHRLLRVDNPRVDRLTVVALRDGRAVQHWETGDRRPFDTRPVPHHAFVFPIELPPGRPVELLVRVDSHDGYQMLMPLALLSDTALQAQTQGHTLLMGLYYGGLGLLLLYHLCLLAITREPSLGLYAAYLAALIVCRVAFEGHAAQYLWPDAPVVANQSLLVAYSLSVVLFGVLLMVNLRPFLAGHPRLRAAGWALVALNALPIPMALAGHYAATLRVINPATFASILFAMAVSVAAWRRGYAHTRWFLLGGGCVLLGLLAERLRLQSLLPDHPLFAYSMAFGSVAQALFIAGALAEGLNRLKADKLAAEQLAREAEARLNEQLGALVHERTQALEAANERLNRLAITDELTGAHNRRHFEHEFAQALSQVQRGGGAMGLCLFDLDHFKGYNDRYGHPAGDEVLRCVTLAVQSTAKRASDRLFRIGGEEFALLMAGRDRDAMARFVEQLRQELEALALPHADNAAGVVTASFGLAWLAPVPPGQPAPEAQALYRFADRLLYRAKAQGRNRCEVGTWDVDEASAWPATGSGALAGLH